MQENPIRCAWCESSDLYRAYHDEEWGFPVGDDAKLFEKLCLEGFQSGLSWLTILKKREAFRAAFAGFDIATVAAFGPADVERLLGDAGIVRHRGKIEAVINNARRALELLGQEPSLAAFIWRHAPPPTPVEIDHLAVPATSPESTALSKALKKRGWSFVGPTTVYAFMQSMGLVNDHAPDCHVRARAAAARAAFQVPT
jgi:DNA-3-methyladenine glycosylase I